MLPSMPHADLLMGAENQEICATFRARRITKRYSERNSPRWVLPGSASTEILMTRTKPVSAALTWRQREITRDGNAAISVLLASFRSALTEAFEMDGAPPPNISDRAFPP